MGIFDFLFSKTSSQSAASKHGDVYAHQRYHARYVINNRDLCVMEHPKHGLFRVVDLSHHGCLVEPMTQASLEAVNPPFFMNLRLCGSSIKVEASECQRRRHGWALVFRHAQEASIADLGRFIEPLRIGRSSVVLDADFERDGIFAKLRRRFIGDGPFEVVFEKNEHDEPSFVMVTLRQGAGDGCVIWNQGTVMTKKSPDTEGAFMPRTEHVDEELVWACASACLGMKFPEGAIAAKVLTDWLSAQSSVLPLAKSS